MANLYQDWLTGNFVFTHAGKQCELSRDTIISTHLIAKLKQICEEDESESEARHKSAVADFERITGERFDP